MNTDRRIIKCISCMEVRMAEIVNVAVDAMGGDNAPAEIVKGAVEAVNQDSRV